MTQYAVEMRGESREVYIVEADSPEGAAENWMNGDLYISEVYGGDVVSVTEEKE